MNSTEVKNFFRSTFGIKCRATTTPTKNAWITAFRPDQEFPKDFRVAVLEFIYGSCRTDKPWIESGSAGNVGPASIAMPAAHWGEFLAQYNVKGGC